MTKRDRTQNPAKGGDFLILGFCAFAGLGLEALLFMAETGIYGIEPGEFDRIQNILHWLFTCALWGILFYILTRISLRSYRYDVFAQKGSMEGKNWAFVIGLIVLMLAVDYTDWGNFKIVLQFQLLGPALFLFQTLYYVFEAGLVTLSVAFGQRAGELWFIREQVPWGGVLAGLLWGAAQILTGGGFLMALLAWFSGIIYGAVYQNMKKNMKIAYPIILLLFVL